MPVIEKTCQLCRYGATTNNLDSHRKLMNKINGNLEAVFWKLKMSASYSAVVEAIIHLDHLHIILFLVAVFLFLLCLFGDCTDDCIGDGRCN